MLSTVTNDDINRPLKKGEDNVAATQYELHVPRTALPGSCRGQWDQGSRWRPRTKWRGPRTRLTRSRQCLTRRTAQGWDTLQPQSSAADGSLSWWRLERSLSYQMTDTV